MEQQITIEDYIAMSRRDHPETSREAAATVNVGALQAKVLTALREAGSRGMTDMELDERFRHLSPTMRPRRVELVRSGLVADSGETVTNTRGRRAKVWVLSEYAI